MADHPEMTFRILLLAPMPLALLACGTAPALPAKSMPLSAHVAAPVPMPRRIDVQLNKTPSPIPAHSRSRHVVYWGMSWVDAPDGGVRIVKIAPDSPAARGGVRVNDVVTQIAGISLTDKNHALVALSERPMDLTEFQVLRNGSYINVRITPEKRIVKR